MNFPIEVAHADHLARAHASRPAIAVTGSTGGLGGRVARILAAGGVPQRLLAREPARAPALPGAHAVRCSFDDPAGATSALQGIDVLLMVSAAESADRLAQHFAFVDAAAAAGVQHVVYTSFQGAAAEATFTLARDHDATEKRLKASGMSWTMLRDNLYLDFMPMLVGDDDVIRGPAGDGRVAAVARDDIARAAAQILLDITADANAHTHSAAHRNATYDLTGPEALTLDEVAAILAGATGRPIRFHDETIAEAYESRRKWNAPAWQNDAWVSTYTAIAAGELAATSTAIADITGIPPMSLTELLGRTG